MRFGYARRLKDLWEIALLGLGTSTHLVVFDVTAMASVRSGLRVVVLDRVAAGVEPRVALALDLLA